MYYRLAEILSSRGTLQLFGGLLKISPCWCTPSLRESQQGNSISIFLKLSRLRTSDLCMDERNLKFIWNTWLSLTLWTIIRDNGVMVTLSESKQVEKWRPVSESLWSQHVLNLSPSQGCADSLEWLTLAPATSFQRQNQRDRARPSRLLLARRPASPRPCAHGGLAVVETVLRLAPSALCRLSE